MRPAVVTSHELVLLKPLHDSAGEALVDARGPRELSLREGFIVGGIWLVLGLALTFGGALIQQGGISAFVASSPTGLAGLLGAATGRFVLFSLLMSGFVGLRNAHGITDKLFLADWRYYVVGVLSLANQSTLGWLWCGMIFQYRQRRHQAQLDTARFARPTSPAPEPPVR